MINISKLYCGLAGESDHLRYSADNSFGPVVVYNCTARCNLNCLHCYSASGMGNCSDELTTAQAKRMIQQLCRVRCPVVLFSGGEPMLRDDLFELLTEARRLGLRTVISTNGTLIDISAAKKLAEAGVSYVGVSIDGDQKFHDSFRRTSGCFKAAIRGIENCKQAGIKTGLRFTIIEANAGQIPAVFELAASIGVRRICFYHLIRSGRAKQLDEQVLTPEQTRRVVDVIIERTQDFAARALVDEVLTVDNHADGPYLL
ncbi:MAG: radical SAM protein, partial [Sedimentisphaerales bacterium]|nr:radical SAM protein [Sedimentisphaerales bacterium]